MPTSEPEPDIAVVKEPPGRYARSHPAGQDIALVVEVAESSFSRDHRKAITYAEGRIPCYWLINLQSRMFEAYDRPEKGIYHRSRILTVTEMPEAVEALDPEFPVTVGDLFV